MLSSKLDDKDVLLSQWGNRGIQRVVAIFKSNEEFAEIGHAYLTITENGDGTGNMYLDSNIMFDSKNERYVQIDDHEIKDEFSANVSAIVYHIKENVELYESGINGYKKVYINSEWRN